MFISKLRPNDSFGLVLFNDNGTTLIPSTLKKNIDMESVLKTV
jgi:hypothetical protein